MNINSVLRWLVAPLLSVALASCASLAKSEQTGGFVDGPLQPGPMVESLETEPGRSDDSAELAVVEPPAESAPKQPTTDRDSEPAIEPETVSVLDPWEGFNRRIHRFNVGVDRVIARPVAKAYVAVVPVVVRSKITNFFDNLGQPATAINALLQGRPRNSAEALGRFLVNSTVGVAGLFDPAARLKMREREEDFGQTLAQWGWRRSRYIELPFLGPRTVRDVLGLVGDTPMQPLTYVEEDKVRVGLQALSLVDGRSRALSLDSLRADAADDYLLVRDSWSQHRNYQIEQDTQEGAALPDYLKD